MKVYEYTVKVLILADNDTEALEAGRELVALGTEVTAPSKEEKVREYATIQPIQNGPQ